jgi:arsenite-transporting ATPase
LRVILFTGKGGVGKTTAAAGTAARAAADGYRTLVLSTDAAHSLADAFGVTGVADTPTEVAPDLSVLQVDAQRRFEQSWAEIQHYLLSVLDTTGMDPVAAEELTVIPGAEEVLALLELRLHVLSDDWDVVVLPTPPLPVNSRTRIGAGYIGAGQAPDSTRFLSPLSAVSMMTFSALRLSMPIIGMFTSTARR